MASFLLLSYHDDPPNGRTGAPFDGYCSDCHPKNNPGGFNGTAEIIGLPDTIYPNTNYVLQLKAIATAGNPVRGGFQLVVVDKNNQNAGNLASINAESDTEFLNAREYLDQRIAKYFNGAPISWNFHWTSPAQVQCNTVKFYYIVNFCNGSGDFGDFSIAFADSVYFAGNPPLVATVTTIQHNTCLEDMNGIAEAQANGGSSPYQYYWSNGSTNTINEGLVVGNYTATILDSEGCQTVDSVTIRSIDSISPELICPISFTACAGDTIHFNLPTIFDNCELSDTQPILISGLPNHTIFPIGSTEEVFQVADLSGNTAICSFQVTVDSCSVGVFTPIFKKNTPTLLPNPITGNYFSIRGLEAIPTRIELVNFQGQSMGNFYESAWPGPYYVDGIPDGIFVLRLIFHNEACYSLRMVKSTLY